MVCMARSSLHDNSFMFPLEQGAMFELTTSMLDMEAKIVAGWADRHVKLFIEILMI